MSWNVFFFLCFIYISTKYINTKYIKKFKTYINENRYSVNLLVVVVERG